MSRLRCLQDFAVAEVDALVECGNPNCRRRVVADPRALLDKIKKERWLHYLSSQCRHMVCGVCGHRGARIAPIPRIVGPLDCPEFQADIDRLWEKVMEDAKNALGFTIEGPDDDGFVWICSSAGRGDWCRNLGTVDTAADELARWLASVDYEERKPF